MSSNDAILFDGSSLTLDFSNVPKDDPVPPGLYPARIYNAELGLSSNGNPQLTLSLEITGPDEYQGSKVRFYQTFTEKSMQYARPTFRALGLSDEDLAGSIDINPNELLGIPVGVRTELVEWMGDTIAKGKRIYPIDALEGVQESSVDEPWGSSNSELDTTSM